MHCCFMFGVVRTYTSGFELYQDKKPNTNKVSMGSSSGGSQTPRCGRKKKKNLIISHHLFMLRMYSFKWVFS